MHTYTTLTKPRLLVGCSRTYTRGWLLSHPMCSCISEKTGGVAPASNHLARVRSPIIPPPPPHHHHRLAFKILNKLFAPPPPPHTTMMMTGNKSSSGTVTGQPSEQTKRVLSVEVTLQSSNSIPLWSRDTGILTSASCSRERTMHCSRLHSAQGEVKLLARKKHRVPRRGGCRQGHTLLAGTCADLSKGAARTARQKPRSACS